MNSDDEEGASEQQQHARRSARRGRNVRGAAGRLGRFGPGGWASGAPAAGTAVGLDFGFHDMLGGGGGGGLFFAGAGGGIMPEVPPPPTFHSIDTAYQLARASASDVERDYLKRCLLCRYGDRVTDGGGQGSHLFSNLVKLVETRVATVRPEELIDIIVSYVDTVIRPAFRAAGRPCPLPAVLDRALMYEHLTTSQHTLNSRLMLINTSRLMERILLVLAQHIAPTGGVPDTKMADVALKYFKELRAHHTTPVGRLAFGAGADGTRDADDLAVDLEQANFASAQTVRHIRRRQGAVVSRILARFHAEEPIAAAAAAAAAGVAADAMSVDAADDVGASPPSSGREEEEDEGDDYDRRLPSF